VSDHSYLAGLLALWREEKNAFWLWCIIKTCIKNDDPFPAEVIEYLDGVADRLLSEETSGGDLGRHLPDVLRLKGRGKYHPLRVNRRMLLDEKFVAGFIAAIFDGLPPAKARERAAVEMDLSGDDRSLQRKLKDFFGLQRLPSDNAVWRKIAIRWMVQNPTCRTRYPHLPLLTGDLIRELA
jgi:hypothetical protein